MLKLMLRLRRSEKGATAIEYGMIISLIVIAMVAGLRNVSNKTNSMWTNVSQNVLNH